jgi:hypothetical protein
MSWTELLKSTVGGLVEFEDEAKRPAAPPVPVDKPTAIVQPTIYRTSPAMPHDPAASALPAQVDTEVLSTLRSKLAAISNSSLWDFKTLEESLASELPDERPRYRAALIASRISYPVLIDSCAKMNQGLDNELQSFSKALEEQKKTVLGGAESDSRNLGEQIASKQREIDELKARQGKLEQAMAAQRAKLDAASEKFNGALAVVRDEISQLQSKIEEYLRK